VLARARPALQPGRGRPRRTDRRSDLPRGRAPGHSPRRLL